MIPFVLIIIVPRLVSIARGPRDVIALAPVIVYQAFMVRVASVLELPNSVKITERKDVMEVAIVLLDIPVPIVIERLVRLTASIMLDVI